jgi:hypothetical protein
MAPSHSLAGTAGKDAIRGFGGFNVSEYNIQDHRFKKHQANFSQQNRSGTKYAGKNALNAPKSVPKKDQQLPPGSNNVFGWREQTLPDPLPGQVAGGFGRLPFSSADTSLLQWKMKHGFGQNDPNLTGMLNEQNLAPNPNAHWRLQSDPFIHSDVGVPSITTQNYMDLPTAQLFPDSAKVHIRGKHDHTNLKEHLTPTTWNPSNTTVATFHTFSNPEFPVVHGVPGTVKATREPLNRPLLYSDLPLPPQPAVIN